MSTFEYINEAVIVEEECYDGFYAVCTNLEDNPETITRVNKQRWQIEECFRIMKSDFEARPAFVKRKDRILAHFMTCFIALIVYRYLEKRDSKALYILAVTTALQFTTKEENADYIEKLCTPVKMKRLSQSALEVLAIVAYKQPVTKGEIEAIRGIKCDRVMEGLMGKGLVEAVGRSQAIGRPILYGTTDMFLKNFGFTSLKDLPEIEDIETAINTEDAEMAEEDKDLDQMELDIEL